MRTLTLEHTPNDLQRGDLLLMPHHKGCNFVVYSRHSATRKTMRLIALHINIDHPTQVARVAQYGLDQSCGYDLPGMLERNDKPFCQKKNDGWAGDWGQVYFMPYDLSNLPDYLQDKYHRICKLLGV